MAGTLLDGLSSSGPRSGPSDAKGASEALAVDSGRELAWELDVTRAEACEANAAATVGEL